LLLVTEDFVWKDVVEERFRTSRDDK
jgi:hypothetical protein